MSQCPVCQTEYTEGEVSCCFVCNWDLTPCPEDFVERQNVHIAWAREIWVKFQVLQQQLPTSINAEIDANPQLSQLREESNLDAWNLLVSWVSTVNLNAAKAAVIRLQERYEDKQPREIAHILIVQKSCQAAGVDLVRGIPGARAILKGLANVNLPTIAKLSAEMIYQIAAIYGVDLQASERQLEVLAAFGAALLGEQAIEAGIDWLKCGIIPGKVISAGAKGLMIYAIGKAACLFYEAKVNQRVNPLISREVFDELREESQDYLENATSEDVIAELILVEIETTPIKISPPKPIKKQKVRHRTSGEAAALRGYFVLPELTEQGMQQRLGRGRIKNVMPLSNELVVVCSTGGAALFNLSSGEALWEIDCPAECSAVSSDGTLLAFGWKEDVYLWDLCTGQLLWQLKGHTDKVINVAISADGRLLASSGYDGTARLWDIVSGREVQQLIGYDSGVYNFAFSPDGKLIASFIEDGNPSETVQLWDVTSGKELQQLKGHQYGPGSVAFSPDGKLVASGSQDETVRLWDVVSGTEVRQLQGHLGSVRSVAFSADGKLLASGGDDSVHLWEVASGRKVRQLKGYTKIAQSVAFTPDSKLLVLGDGDGSVRLWDVATGREVRQIQGCYVCSGSLTLSSEGKLLALVTSDEMVRLWDIARDTEVKQLLGRTDWVENVAFSPDGKLLVSWSRTSDKIVQLWDLSSGREVRHLVGHTCSVESVAFTPDGKLVATASGDGVVRLWKVEI
jgi:WD40 repeat protein/uncharacterized protein (DUF697 family)